MGVLNSELHALVRSVRAGKRSADLAEVNAALMQPHWRSHDHWIQPDETPAQ